MKLYLCSYRIPNLPALTELVGKNPADTRVTIIPNAKDYYADRPREFKVSDTVEYLQEIGFVTNICDLRDYNKPAALRKAFAHTDLIWAMGGNTFQLREEMKRSGFDDIVEDLLKEGIVYAGESAGAVVAGNSLKGVEHADDARFATKLIWDGLGLIDQFVLPHVGSQDYGDGITEAKEAHKGEKIVALRDDQALVVNGATHAIV